MIKQSVCYPILPLGDMKLDELFGHVADIGFPAVEMWGRGDDFLETIGLAKRHGLVVASMCGHGSLGDGMNNRSNHDRIEAELKESIEIAAEHGIPGLICFSGNRREGQTEADSIQTTAEGFRRIAPYAEKYGVNLNMELLNSKIDHQGYECDHTSWGVAVCEAVGSPNVKLLYDIYHMQIMEGDVIRTISENIGWIGHFHTAGVPGRHDLDDTQELNYSAIFRAIASSGYELYVGHEFIPKGDPMAALASAYRLGKD